MPFQLSRGGSNVPAEVQRWQYFMRRQGIDQVGVIDSDFGIKTETATKVFQTTHQISVTGQVNDLTLTKAAGLGYKIVPDDYYHDRSGPDFPPKPTNLSSPSNASRNTDFTCFKFSQLPLNQRSDKEDIVQKGSCDGAEPDWAAALIIAIQMPQLKFARGFSGTVKCHKLAAPKITALFNKWEQDDLLHLILSYEGCFVPRYKRHKAPPGTAGHGEKKSSNVDALSNHSFGSAFDINYDNNHQSAVPAFCGQRGSTRELVASANELGIFWGGHFSPLDGNHFEISKLS